MIQQTKQDEVEYPGVRGPVAQMGERRLCTAEVTSSNLVGVHSQTPIGTRKNWLTEKDPGLLPVLLTVT